MPQPIGPLDRRLDEIAQRAERQLDALEARTAEQLETVEIDYMLRSVARDMAGGGFD